MGPAEPEVSTSTGRVRGRIEHGNAVFRGIPFAKPPLRALGSRHPRRLTAGTASATRASSARSARRRPSPAPRRSRTDTTGEWLTVNVWTPDPAAPDAPGHGLDPRRRVPVRLGRPRLRRHPVRERRGGLRLLQLPPGHGGLRPDPRRARQPRPAGRGRGAALGQGQHRAVRRRPGERHRLRRVGRRRA